MSRYYSVTWREDEPAPLRARLTAADGSGDATGRAGEGNWLEQDDFDSIAYTLFRDGTQTEADTLTIADVILDTPVTATTNWAKDATGYNFYAIMPASLFPTGGSYYRLEIKFTLTSGNAFHLVFEGPTESLSRS